MQTLLQFLQLPLLTLTTENETKEKIFLNLIAMLELGLQYQTIKTRVWELAFIYDKNTILIWVLVDWESISDKLKFELEKRIESIDLWIYVSDDNTDILVEKNFEDWLDEFQYFIS